MNIKQLSASIFLGLLACASCIMTPNGFSKDELALIHGADSIMHVLTIDNPAESLVLRTPSSDLSARTLLSEDYRKLCALMVATVTHPSQDGVGIAGPQVGINRRIVAVQRFDKEPTMINGKQDYPFEVYPNIRIVWGSDSLAYGPEGCLSVPGKRGDVLRSQEIVIEYVQTHFEDTEDSEPIMVRDTVKGFTAVIFQHEVDHLDGMLYIDRLSQNICPR